MKRANKESHRHTETMACRPLILAIETSSRVGSVALVEGADFLGQITFSAPMQHSAEIFPAIVNLLNRSGHNPSDLNQVHLSIGPGSFTGLRIAVTTAKAMHLANGVRIVAVDSLDAIAANVKDAALEQAFQSISEDAPDPRRLATVLDAKRGQFFTAVYEYACDRQGPGPTGELGDPDYRIPAPAGGFWRKTLPDCLMNVTELRDRFAHPKNPILVAGDGLLYHQDRFQLEGIRVLEPAYWSPQATAVALLGRQKASAEQFSDPLTLVPFYLRGPEVTLRKRT